jgi:hypothetical protein
MRLSRRVRRSSIGVPVVYLTGSKVSIDVADGVVGKVGGICASVGKGSRGNFSVRPQGRFFFCEANDTNTRKALFSNYPLGLSSKKEDPYASNRSYCLLPKASRLFATCSQRQLGQTQ